MTDGSLQNVVYIDKPFVSKRLNQREKNEKFYKRSLMVTLVKNQITNRNLKTKQPSVANYETINEKEEEKKLQVNTGDQHLDYDAENKLVKKIQL